MSVPWYLMAKGKGGGGYKTASGPIVSVNDALAAPLRSLVANIEPVQDLHGYDNPWPAGGGKNLYNKDGHDYSNGYIATEYLKSDGTQTQPTAGNWQTSEYIPITGGLYYTISGLSTSDSHSPAMCYYDSSKSFISGMPYQNRAQITHQSPSNAAYVRLSIGPTATTQDSIQFEQSASKTPYAPYSNICPISGWSECKVWRTGKNLLEVSAANLEKPSYYPGTWTGTGVASGENAITVTRGRGSGGFGGVVIPSGLKAGTYTFSCEVPTTSSAKDFFCGFTVNGVYPGSQISLGSVVGSKAKPVITFTLDNDTDSFFIKMTTANEAVPLTFSKLQIEPGSVENPSFVPYSGNQYTIQLGDTYYGGTLDVTNGVLTVTLKEFSYSSVSYYGTYGNDNANLYYMSIPDYSIERIRNMQNAGFSGTLISNMLKKTTTYDTGSMKDNEIRTKAGDVPDLFYFRADSFADLTELNAFLADNPLQVVAELATPITIPLTATQISTLQGQNNVWADSGDVTVEYPASGGVDPDLMKLTVAFMGRK